MNSVIIRTKIIVFKGSNGLVNYSIKYINFTIKDNILNIPVSRYKTILIYITIFLKIPTLNIIMLLVISNK